MICVEKRFLMKPHSLYPINTFYRLKSPLPPKEREIGNHKGLINLYYDVKYHFWAESLT